VAGWEAELRAETKRRLEHERAEEGPRQTLRAQRDANLGKPSSYKLYTQPQEKDPEKMRERKEKQEERGTETEL
jgi:hypothetical protein